MKTKFKLAVLLCFTFNAILGQSKWMGMQPANINDSILTVQSIEFDSLNHAYVFGKTYNSQYSQLFYQNGSTWESYTIDKGEDDRMIMDKNGKLWFVTGGYSLSCFDPATSLVTDILLPQLQLYKKFINFTVDSSGKKWVLEAIKDSIYNYTYSLFEYDGINWTVYDSTVTGLTTSTFIASPIDSFSIGVCKVLASTNTSNVYAIGGRDYIAKFDGANWTKIDSSNTNFPSLVVVHDAVIDSHNNIWMEAYSQTLGYIIVKYDGISFQTIIPPASVYGISVVLNEGSMMIDSSDNLFVFSSFNGLIKFDGSNWTFNHPMLDALMPWYSAGFLKADKKGNIWCASYWASGSAPITIFNENGFQTIDGNVFKDDNANGMHDVNENGMQREMITSSEGMCNLTDSAGNYHLYFTDSSNTVTVSHNSMKYRYHSNIPNSYVINPIAQSTSGYDFGVADVPNITDIRINCYFYCTRPGFYSYAGIDYDNIGTTTISDTITIQLDGRYTFLNSYPSPISINGNKLQWLYANLAPLDNRHIGLYLRVDSTAVIGDTLFSLATIGPVISDTVPSDNINFIYKVVHGSYDPNEKEVEPKGTGPNGNIPNGQTLNYTIHFQNTGTDTAFTVTVKDTLSSNLDINTFQFTGSSHPCIYEITGAGNMKFTFYDILLTDTFTNEPLSHGYVSYKIKAIDNLPLGTEIKNTAFIYFDFNAPIVTNTTLNTITNTTGIPFLKSNYSANVFPNPLHDVATLEINGMNFNSKLTVKLYDAMGREMNVAVSKMDNNRFAIHRNDLTSGLYFYQVSDGNVLISSGKITVQ